MTSAAPQAGDRKWVFERFTKSTIESPLINNFHPILMGIKLVALTIIVSATACELRQTTSRVGAGAGAPTQLLAPPESVVEMFYAREHFPEKRRHLTQEMAIHLADAPTIGSQLPPGVAVNSRALHLDSARAIYSTTLRHSRHTEDWYTYLLREDNIWKIAAIRSLAFPQPHFVLLDTMQAQAARRELSDSLLPVMQRLQLAVQSDSALGAYLREHESALRSLAELFAARPGLEAVSVDGHVGPAGVTVPDRLIARMRRLRIGALLRDPGYPACVFLKIGGAGSSQVGYIYAPAGCTPPAMSPADFIYVEAVAPNWYVYKAD